jgi:MFS family permease
VLPAVFLEVGSTLGVGPQALGTLSMVGSLTVGFASPVAGWLGTRFSRPHLIAYGCLTWSVGAVGMGASSSYGMLVLARGMNGIGLGMIGPLMFGMVVDAYPAEGRGQALGILGAGALCAHTHDLPSSSHLLWLSSAEM